MYTDTDSGIAYIRYGIQLTGYTRTGSAEAAGPQPYSRKTSERLNRALAHTMTRVCIHGAYDAENLKQSQRADLPLQLRAALAVPSGGLPAHCQGME